MITRPIHPFNFSDQRYWDAAQKVDVQHVIAVLETQGWEHRRVGDFERFKRVDYDGQVQDFSLPLVKDAGFVSYVLNGALLLGAFDYLAIDDVLEEWGAPCERRNVAEELRRKRQEARERERELVTA